MVRRPRVPALLAAGALALGLLVTGLPAAHVARASTAEQLVTPDLVARAPVESLARGQTGTTGIPVTLKWPVFQAGAGGVRYAVEANVNAGGFTPVTLSWPGAQGVTVYLAPGARYQYRDQATDAAGTQTEWMGGPVFGVNVAQESSSDIAYSATWTQTTLAGAYGGSVRFATAAGAKATTTLLGTSVGVVSTLGPDRGLADIYLDGIRVAGVDLYAPTTVRHQVVYVANGLTDATHTVMVRVTGTRNAASSGSRVDVDAFERLYDGLPADVSVTLTDLGSVIAGIGGHYDIAVANHGPNTALNVRMLITMTVGTRPPATFGAAPRDTLAPGQGFTTNLAVTVLPDDTGSVMVTVTVAASNDITPSNNSATDTRTILPAP